jgi:predicted Zn-dependent protease
VTPVTPLSFHVDAAGRHRIDFASPPRLLTIAFTLLWLSGWLLLLTLTVLEYTRFGSLNLLSIVLLAGGPPVALALLWMALGKRETLLVSPGEVRINRWVGPIPLSRTFEPHDITGIRVATVSGGPLADLEAIRQFYGGGNGCITIDTRRGPFTVGHDVSADADGIVERARQLLPQLSSQTSDSGSSRPRMAARAAGFMTMVMVGFALNVPVKLAIVDRAICFYDDTAVPRQPIDVSGMRPPGQVYLVPVDDFPADDARALAEYFRTTFRVAIEVAPALAWPEGAYVAERRQMDSAVMLTRLEEIYTTADAPVVAIALTTRDMFNPGVNWRYVFSYRRHNRMAIVSPARMDRGCMGLFQADDARIMARLRRMVGKNIGIMYFGLEMSGDPVSMLYRNIGGPQELDAMSERF